MKTRNTVNRGSKFIQVRDGASSIFLRDGFAMANVDEIARAARVSKATLYNYFPEKKLMFQEAFDAAMTATFQTTPVAVDPLSRAWPGLEQMLHQLGNWLMTPTVLQIHRIALAEAGRFPELARAYRMRLEAAVLVPLTRQIELWSARGDLQAGDCTLLARQIFALLTAGLQQSALLGKDEDITSDDIAAHVRSTADLMLRAHGPKATVTARA